MERDRKTMKRCRKTTKRNKKTMEKHGKVAVKRRFTWLSFRYEKTLKFAAPKKVDKFEKLT